MEKYRLDECCEILDSQRIPITGQIELLVSTHIMAQMEFKTM